jgi:hypothetical protein
MKTPYLLISLLIIGSWACGKPSVPSPAPQVVEATAKPLIKPATIESQTHEMKLFSVWYPDSSLEQYQRSCGASSATERSVPEPSWSASKALHVLFAGPTEEEKSRGLLDPYGPEMTFGKENTRLEEYFLGVSIESNTAVVNFKPSAMNWLNGPACAQESVKTPMIRTLEELFGVKKVDFAIDGVIVEDWDA